MFDVGCWTFEVRFWRLCPVVAAAVLSGEARENFTGLTLDSKGISEGND
jgi:hypothetical protein